MGYGMKRELLTTYHTIIYMTDTFLTIAKRYDSPEDFKKNNFAMYSICKAKGLLSTAFPEQVATAKKEYLKDVRPALPEDAGIRDALDDLIVQYRGIPSKPGKIRKVTVNKVIRDIEQLLKDH